MDAESNRAKAKAELLEAIDNCTSFAELFQLVKTENIDIRMQPLSSASNIPPKELALDETSAESPIQRMKDTIKLAVENAG